MKRIMRLAALAAILCLVPVCAEAEEQEGVITGDRVNLRTGPGLSHASLGHLDRGDTVLVSGMENGWYAVTRAGQKGYVSGAYVQIRENEASGQGTASPNGILKWGDRGERVRTLQGNLICLGYLNDRADGSFGAKTEAAVHLYQRRNGLDVDGIVGRATSTAIEKEVLRVIAVVETAKRYLGLPYATAGSSPETGFDCSGLTQYAHRAAGLAIPRVSYEQAAAGLSVPRAQMRPGDLVAFNHPVSHVGIYLGNGRFIHSPKPGDRVKITDLQYMNLTAVRRYTGQLVRS